MPTNINLPANLPENWQAGQIVSPSGTEVGLSAQHGYNYLMQQVNDTQEAANTLSQAVDSQEEAQAQLETDVETLQTDMTQAKSDVESLQTDVGNLQTGQGQLATPNATAAHSGSVVAITAPAGVNLISFYAPSDFSGDDTYTVNGSAVTLTDLNGNAVYNGWKEGAPVQLILKGAQAFFKSGGGVNDTLPPLNPNMTGELADGVFTVTADKLPVAQADALAGAEWYYGDHVPARPGDGTKVEFTREQLITSAPGVKAASEYTPGDIVTIKENGSPVEFICLKHGYPTLDNGMTLFYRKNIYSILDRITGISPDYDYTGSTLDTYMEATYKAVLSPYVRNIIQPVNIAVRTGKITRSIFPLSNGELGDTSDPVIGNAIAYFASDAQRISNYGSSPAQYATRLFNDYGVYSVCCVTKSGAFQRIAIGSLSNVGVRPAFVLPSSTLFSADTNELIEDATAGISTLADVQPLSGESISDEGTTVTLSIPWTESGYIYVRQFPYNAKHQYQTQLVGAVATNDPDYGGAPNVDPVLANNTWEQIAAASESGIAADTWQVGDTKDIVVGGETLTVEIVGFNHDDLANGSGKAGITFGLKNLMANTRQMNSSNTNAGGFTGSDMYEWLQGTLLNSLPSDLRAVLKSVNKMTSAGSKSTTINTNAMKIFLFSEIEIFGSTTYSVAGEGSQYSRFATASSRIKYLSNGSGAANNWWERSPNGNGSNGFCTVNSNGSADSNYANSSRGVCFGFCV